MTGDFIQNKPQNETAPHGALTIIARVLALIKIVGFMSPLPIEPFRQIFRGLGFYGSEFFNRAGLNIKNGYDFFVVLYLFSLAVPAFLIFYVVYPREIKLINYAFAIINAADLIGFTITLIIWNFSGFVVLGMIFSAICTAVAVVKLVLSEKTNAKHVSRPVKVACVVLATLFVLSFACVISVNKIGKQTLYTEVYENADVKIIIKYHPFDRISFSYDSDNLMTGGTAEFVSENRAEVPEESGLFSFGVHFRFSFVFNGDSVTVYFDSLKGESVETLTLVSRTKDS